LFSPLFHRSSVFTDGPGEQWSRWIIVISYHSHFVPAISYHSENHFRIITISYHMQIDTLLPFRTICRSIHYMTISYHMQIDTLYDHFVPYADRYIIWPFRTICRLTHMTFSNLIKKYIMTISYHMQIDTLWLFREFLNYMHNKVD
jgi:hypothetical protein